LPFLLASLSEITKTSGLQSFAEGRFKHIQLWIAPQLNQPGSSFDRGFVYYANILEASLNTVNLIVKSL